MLIEHRGVSPTIDSTAAIAPSAVISGDVRIGPHTAVLAGAVITAEGAPVQIGAHCVIMEQAVIRGAGKSACTLGPHVLVGPHAYVSDATIDRQCFLATGATVFNTAVLKAGTWVAVQGVVHIGTYCPPPPTFPLAILRLATPQRFINPTMRQPPPKPLPLSVSPRRCLVSKRSRSPIP